METFTYIITTSAANPHSWPFVFGLLGLWGACATAVFLWGAVNILKWLK